VKPVQDIIGSVEKNLKKNKNKIKIKKIRKSGPGQYRKFEFSKKMRKRSVKPVLATIGSLNF
jgi:hypothetical protein